MSLFGDDAADRAAELFGDAGFFDGWRRVATFNASQVPIPGSVEVQAAPEFIDLTQDSLAVALAWDDATTHEAGPVEVQAGRLVRLDVNARRGLVLEVWAAGWDNLGAARLFPRSVAVEREQERAEADQDNANKPPPTPGDLAAQLATAAAVVLGLVVAVKLFSR